MLVRTPSDGFDSSGVVNKLMLWDCDLIPMTTGSISSLVTPLVEGHASNVPDEQLVVVASRGELFVIKGPPQPTHLLLVTTELMDKRGRGGGRGRG